MKGQKTFRLIRIQTMKMPHFDYVFPLSPVPPHPLIYLYKIYRGAEGYRDSGRRARAVHCFRVQLQVRLPWRGQPKLRHI